MRVLSSYCDRLAPAPKSAEDGFTEIEYYQWRIASPLKL